MMVQEFVAVERIAEFSDLETEEVVTAFREHLVISCHSPIDLFIWSNIPQAL